MVILEPGDIFVKCLYNMKIVWYNVNMKVWLIIIVLLFSSCSYPQNEAAQSTEAWHSTNAEYPHASEQIKPSFSTAPTLSPTLSPTPFERKDVMNSPKIVICKSERMLYMYDGEMLCAKIEIALGFAPQGHKRKQGDGKTPEGEYYICTKNDKSKYYLALAISYPNIQDAQEGLDKGIISQEDYENIKDAISNGKRPSWDTALGGEIMIHGSDTSTDWTAGCIATANSDIDYLWENCPIGTPVTILP